MALLAFSIGTSPQPSSASEFANLYKIADVADPLFGQQWAVNGTEPAVNLGLQSAWQSTRGENTVIAIVDTGIVNHPDLNSNILPGYDFISNTSMSNDGDGWDSNPQDPGDWVTSSESAGLFGGNCDAASSSWHGTHVAGIAAASGDNGLGIKGVAPDAKILPVRAIGKCGAAQSDMLAAITWASGGHVAGVPDNPNKADVINLSLGQQSVCQPATQSVIDAAISRGSVVVAAAGNSALPVSQFSPANCNGVIRVGAIAKNGELSTFSNYTSANDQNFVVAPGGDKGGSTFGILSTVDSGTQGPTGPSYASYVGTSMASPHVAGLVALVKSANPQLSGMSLISESLRMVKLNSSSKCLTGQCGRGQIDVSGLGNSAALTLGNPFVKRYEDKVSLEWPATPLRLQSASVELQISKDSATWLTVGSFSLPRLEIKNLERGVSYSVRYRISLKSKTGDWIDPGIKIGLSNKAAAPTSITLTPGDGTLQVSWVEQLGDTGQTQIGYLARATSKTSGQATTCSTKKLTCTIYGLQNGVEHAVTVTAVTTEGLTTVSNSFSATPFTVPAPPMNVTATDQINTLRVSWDKPLDDGGRAVTGYAATATTSSGYQKKCESAGYSCNIEELNPRDIVDVQVVAVNLAGISKKSQPLTEKYEPYNRINLIFKKIQTAKVGKNTEYSASWIASPIREYESNFKINISFYCGRIWLPEKSLPLTTSRATKLPCAPTKARYTLSDGFTTQSEIVAPLK